MSFPNMYVNKELSRPLDSNIKKFFLSKLVQLEEFQTLVPFRVRCVLRVGKLMDWVVLVACPVHINQGWKNQIVLIVSEWVVFVFVVVVVHFSDVIFNVIVRCSPF